VSSVIEKGVEEIRTLTRAAKGEDAAKIEVEEDAKTSVSLASPFKVRNARLYNRGELHFIAGPGYQRQEWLTRGGRILSPNVQLHLSNAQEEKP